MHKKQSLQVDIFDIRVKYFFSRLCSLNFHFNFVLRDLFAFCNTVKALKKSISSSHLPHIRWKKFLLYSAPLELHEFLGFLLLLPEGRVHQVKWKQEEDIRKVKKKVQTMKMWKPEAFGMNTANFIMMKFYDVKFCVCRKAFFAFGFALSSSSSFCSLDLI